ncbi:nucleoside triphosphate pyrophosphohydrolase [Orbaceae bacterium ESL0727]|nr:nucleoside triphosphate pyrophosphohydrolase [Orbaceae bacterium ESL0727]
MNHSLLNTASPNTTNSHLNELQRLLSITQQLRHPITGCEWDRVQTCNSLKAYTLEETYELLDAIDKQDSDEIKKELGDLLFHIIFYADLANEAGTFNFNDVCRAVADKLIARHPHIFKNAQASASASASEQEQTVTKPNWEQLKQKERDQKAQYSVLDDIPAAMPALMRAEKIQKRCASVGFDWANTAPVLDKVKEELIEVTQELNRQSLDQQKMAEEVGDLFFATVNLARHLKIESELCLQQANQKFERRFRHVEQLLKEKNIPLNQATLAEMEEAWQSVKQLEKQSELS